MPKSKPKKKIIVRKEETDTTQLSDSENTISTDSFIKDTDYTSETYNTYKKRERFITLAESDYKTPKNGTRQDNLTSDEILGKIKEYVPLKTMEEKKVLKNLQPFKTWIKYINTETGKFRNGGLLMKVVYPDYIMLINSISKITWSVQLENNIIFVKHPKIIQKEKQIEEIKDELYNLYIKGELKRIE